MGCPKCSGYIDQRIIYAEGYFLKEVYCFNCGWRYLPPLKAIDLRMTGGFIHPHKKVARHTKYEVRRKASEKIYNQKEVER